MAIDFTLPLRALQALFAIIVVGTTGYVANVFIDSPSQVNFLIFVSIWTFLALLFLTLVPMFMRNLAHPFVLLGVEALTMIFWFAGFIALAVYVSDFNGCFRRVCSSLRAAVVFAAFEWLLWLATTILTALRSFRSGGANKAGAAPGPAVVA